LNFNVTGFIKKKSIIFTQCLYIIQLIAWFSRYTSAAKKERTLFILLT